MRLIDADEFKRQIAGMAIISGYSPQKANALCELIDNQPTAYDLDNVVEQLEDRSTLSRPVGWLRSYEIVTLEAAIKVVRGGEIS